MSAARPSVVGRHPRAGADGDHQQRRSRAGRQRCAGGAGRWGAEVGAGEHGGASFDGARAVVVRRGRVRCQFRERGSGPLPTCHRAAGRGPDGWDHGPVPADGPDPTPGQQGARGRGRWGHRRARGGPPAGERSNGARVTVLEAAPALGGKLARAELAGLPGWTPERSRCSTGGPEAVGPGPARSAWVTTCATPPPRRRPSSSAERVGPLPPTVLGVPSDLRRPRPQRRACRASGVARAGLERVLPGRRLGGARHLRGGPGRAAARPGVATGWSSRC